MKFKAEINIMPQKEILDPQGKAVKLGLANLGINTVEDVRVGKHITLELEAENHEQAEEFVKNACKKLLANIIMEDYSFNIFEKK
jgi:phosphoribosylformylglycinamidine synthase